MKNKIRSYSLIYQTYLLIFIGISLLYSASKGVITKFEALFLKQILWMVLGTVILFFIKKIDYRNYRRISKLLYFAILFFLIIVLFVGHGRASRWIRIGWFNFQPSEFAKIVIIFSLSSYLTERMPRKPGIFISSLIIGGLPILLIMKQPNLGTAFIILLIILGILYQAGATKKQFLVLFLCFLFASPLIWSFLRDYQKDRILTFLNPQRDPLGKGYNLLQSIITIGSGGLIGKGFLKGTQTKLAFLPEYHTDFIFCLLGEEFGFIGVLLLLYLYYLFLNNIINITFSTKDRFAKLVSSGIFIMFFSQIFINIGMTVGLLPIAGIPLPFISYGGSSFIVSCISIGVLMNIKENSTLF